MNFSKLHEFLDKNREIAEASPYLTDNERFVVSKMINFVCLKATGVITYNAENEFLKSVIDLFPCMKKTIAAVIACFMMEKVIISVDIIDNKYLGELCIELHKIPELNKRYINQIMEYSNLMHKKQRAINLTTSLDAKLSEINILNPEHVVDITFTYSVVL